MNIVATPDDILRRCLFSDFKRFVLKDKSEAEIQLLVKENKPISLSENDAYAIGLLKVIETDNLIHRFMVHMKEIINIPGGTRPNPQEKLKTPKQSANGQPRQ